MSKLEHLSIFIEDGLSAFSHVPEQDHLAEALLGKSQLGWYIGEHVNCQLYDPSDVTIEGTAIYTLSDPRDLRLIRYVGQTTAPRRRFLQHLNSARLWMPATTPWWIKSPKLKPLYEWIRALYRDGRRLPTMVVEKRVTDSPHRAEQLRIQECVSAQFPLLNVQSKKPPKKSARKAVRVR